MVIFLAVFGDFIANENPIAVRDKSGSIHFPIFQMYGQILKGEGRQVKRDWNENQSKVLLMPLIPYSAQTIDLKNANYISPFGVQEVERNRYRHWLGTDALGRDVLAGLIRGFRIALLIGFLSMLFALVMGLPIGTLMGYLGDEAAHFNLIQICIVILSIILFCFYSMLMFDFLKLELLSFFGFSWRILLFSALAILFILFTGRWFPHLRKWRFPVDFMGMRVIEVLRSIPGLFLLLALLSLSIHPSVLFVSFIIGFLRWPGIARYVRAEVMKVKEQDYIKSAKSLGLSEWKVIYRHLLPNAISPIIVAVAFGFASAILLESGLSFLGLGLAVEDVSWGKILSGARSRMDAWWLVLFPGLAIFATIYCCNLLGDRLTEKLNPKLRDSTT